MTMESSTLDERFGGTLAPDAMLPSQFFSALYGRGDLSAERRLVVAVLEDALHCYQKYVDAENPKQRQLFLDAEEWIMGDNPTWFFSFPNVCDTLNLDSDYMREGLTKWRDAHRRAVARAPMPAPSVQPAASEEDDEEQGLRRASGG
jgi:hypothetical protein